VDFVARPDEAVRTINAWVSDKTREKIKVLIQRNRLFRGKVRTPGFSGFPVGLPRLL
jgi:serine protease inhibitor